MNETHATVVDRWTGRESRLLREALRLSVRGFAEYLGVPARTVSRWEQHGVDRVPRPECQQLLDTALARGTSEQVARFDQARRAQHMSPEDEEQATDRRSFLSLTALSALSGHPGPGSSTSVDGRPLVSTWAQAICNAVVGSNGGADKIDCETGHVQSDPLPGRSLERLTAQVVSDSLASRHERLAKVLPIALNSADLALREATADHRHASALASDLYACAGWALIKADRSLAHRCAVAV